MRFLGDGTFIFASELKGLLAHPNLSREMDPHSIEEYFSFGYVPEPKTIFKQAFKLSPGHSLTLRHGQNEVQQQQYWDVPFSRQSSIDVQEAQEELIVRLKEAVKIRLMSEVPLGAFLSGGVDFKCCSCNDG